MALNRVMFSPHLPYRVRLPSLVSVSVLSQDARHGHRHDDGTEGSDFPRDALWCRLRSVTRGICLPPLAVPRAGGQHTAVPTFDALAADEIRRFGEKPDDWLGYNCSLFFFSPRGISHPLDTDSSNERLLETRTFNVTRQTSPQSTGGWFSPGWPCLVRHEWRCLLLACALRELRLVIGES